MYLAQNPEGVMLAVFFQDILGFMYQVWQVRILPIKSHGKFVLRIKHTEIWSETSISCSCSCSCTSPDGWVVVPANVSLDHVAKHDTQA